MSTRIVNQINQAADSYLPAVYQTLTQFSDFERSNDAMAAEFIPLSQARVSRESKLMVFGVLPPTANVSGKLLDRSYSSVETPQPNKTPPGQPPDASGESPADPGGGWYDHARTLPPEFWANFVGMAERAHVDPIELAAVFANESGFNPSRTNPGGGPAKGLGQLTPGAHLKEMDPATWAKFETLSASEQLAYFEPYVKRMRWSPKTKRGSMYAAWLGGFQGNPSVDGGSRYVDTSNPAALAAALAAADSEYKSLTANPSKKFSKAEMLRIGQLEYVISSGRLPRHDFQALAYAQNKGLDKNKDGIISTNDLELALKDQPPQFIRDAIAGAKACGGTGPVPKQETTQATQQDAPATVWCQNGAEMSEEEKRRQGIMGPTGYNSTKLGQHLMDAQRAQIQETQWAIQQMRDTPPLKLLVNPNQWSVNHEKILTDGDRSRRGPIIQVWGAGQPKISASGKVPGFFSLSVPDANGPGLTRHARNYSAGWQNFQSLYTIYRNNGRIYLNDHLGGGGAMNLSLVGSVYIYYDNTLYIGSFDSLNVTESDTAPHTAEYQFEFSVRAMFLLDVPIDPGLQQGNLDYLRGGALPGDSTLGRGPTFG